MDDEKQKERRSKTPITRMPADDRRRFILQQATSFFAEFGFDANTRQLAERLGVTQPLLFSYFPTKEKLIEAVFIELYARQGNREWLSIISNPLQPLRERLVEFSRRYAASTYDHDWIRLYMFAALAGGNLNRYYISSITEPLLYQIAIEIRREHGLLPVSEAAVTRQEIEYLWLFHAGLYYAAIRTHIYGIPVDADANQALVELSVDTMLFGYAKLLKSSAPARVKRKPERPKAKTPA
jgi:AcrR family transcriptional regulator